MSSPEAQQRGMGQTPLLAGLLPQHLLTEGCTEGIFRFLDETRPENFKVAWELQSVFYAAGLMVSVRINPLHHFEYHPKDLE